MLPKTQANRDDILLNALLVCPTVKEAAKNTKIPERTIYKRLADTVFKARYDEARRRVLDETVSYLQMRMNDSFSVLINIVNNDKIAPQVRINAADRVLFYTIKLTETTDLLKRIEALEAVAKNGS